MRFKLLLIRFVYVAVAIAISSCVGEFSKYTPDGDNDLEGHFKGKVKEVKTYSNGELIEIERYNKYGFYKERICYDNSKVSEHTWYRYNEYGKILEKEYKDEKRWFVKKYSYDSCKNVIEIIETTKEVYDNNNDRYKIGDRLICSYKYTYDKLGGLIKSQEFSRLGTCTCSILYNSEGKVKRSEAYNEDNGELKSFTEFQYDYSGGEVMKDYLVDEDGPYIALKLEFNSKGQLIKSINYLNNEASTYEHTLNGKKETCVWVINERSLKIFPEYQKTGLGYRITEDTKDAQGHVIKSKTTTYYPWEDMNVSKEPDECHETIYKYDSHGNMIYRKSENEDNREYTYSIKYF